MRILVITLLILLAIINLAFVILTPFSLVSTLNCLAVLVTSFAAGVVFMTGGKDR